MVNVKTPKRGAHNPFREDKYEINVPEKHPKTMTPKEAYKLGRLKVVRARK